MEQNKIEARYSLVAMLLNRAEPMLPGDIIATIEPLIAFIFQTEGTPVPFKVVK